MAIPDFQTLMLPVLRLAAQEQIKTSVAIERLSDDFMLTEQERLERLPSGRQTTMANRVHWAFTYLGKAGLIERVQRATYVATDDGRKVLESPPQRIDIRYLSTFPKFAVFRAKTEQPDGPSATDEDHTETATPEEAIEKANNLLEEALRADLLDKCRNLSPAGFERLIVDLMLAMGYGVSGTGTHVGKSGDGGVDGIITEDALGLDVVCLQAKRYAEGNNVGVNEIRAFAGTLDEAGAAKGVFVTTSKFAPSARDFNSRSKRIELIDGERLVTLMAKYGVGTRIVRKIEFKKMDSDYFDDLDG